MSGKLPIRRVGNFLPHICLVLLLVVVGVIIWLSTVGIPGCAVRRIEAEAAKAGIPLRIEKIQLIPRAGLAIKAERLSLEIPQPDAPAATLRLRKAQLVFSLPRLLNGDWTPQNLRVKGGFIEVPTGSGEQERVSLDHIDIDADFLAKAKGINVRVLTYFNKIKLDTKLAFALDETSLEAEAPEQEKKGQLVDISEIGQQLKDLRPTLQQAQALLAAQNWTQDLPPTLDIKILGGKKWKTQLDAWIPSFDMDYLHTRDATIEATFENDTLTISTLKLHTVDPDSTVSLQAAYDLTTRELEFNTHSSAPLFNLVDSYLGDASAPILKKIKSQADTTPLIELSGSAAFTEDFALNRITLRGKIEHKGVDIGNTHINHLLLTFFVRDGSFNVDNLLLELPEGHLRASAQAENGIGTAKVDIDLSDETLLALVRDIAHAPELSLPDELQFEENLKLRASCEVASTIFQPGKTRLEDLIPSLKNARIQFNTPHIRWDDCDVNNTSLSIQVDDIELGKELIRIGGVDVTGLAENASSEAWDMHTRELLYDIKLQQIQTTQDFHALTISQVHATLNLAAAKWQDKEIETLHATMEFADFHTNWQGGLNALRSNKIIAKLQAEKAVHAQDCAKGISMDLIVPEGLKYTDGWKNMQKDAELNLSVAEFRRNGDFCMTGTQVDVRQTADDECRLTLTSRIGNEQLALSCSASLEQEHYLLLNNINASLPVASAAPLMGGEPIKEIKLPRIITLQGDALLDTRTYRLVKTHYDLHIPEFVRVCNEVHVHKGMEIPLELQIKGDFSTAEDGTMNYEADVRAIHQTGELQVHVNGNPLRDCHITGTNTITVDVVNALIDNPGAHWIMRDFRCTPGVTKHNITDIDATLRYDKGFYLRANCKAQLKNLEFLLGAIRAKYDSKGNETGEEYLRTDLSPNPYTLVKEARCDVEVIVQLDCTDENGNALPERLRINLENPYLLYDNRPWLKRNGFKKGALTSSISGEAVRFNIENNTISLHNLKGNCYPAYSIGMYYAPIQHFLEDIILKDPVDIATDYCIFPLSRNCDVPMRGLIRTYGATGAGFRFLGTTIPFEHFSGFINISDTDVYLDQMNAQCWGGVMNAALRIGFSGKHTSLDGYVEAHNLNLQDIVSSYGASTTPACCSGNIRFQATKPELEDVIAYGEVSLKDGDLMQLSLFRPVESLLSDMPGHLSKLQRSVTNNPVPAEPTWADKLVNFLFDTGSSTVGSVQESSYGLPFANHFLRYGIDSAFSRFDIRDGHLITRDMKAKGYNLNVETQLDIDLNNLTLKGDLWPRISSVPTVLISPITILSKFLIDINIYGDLLDPQWEIGLSKKLKGEDASLTPEPQKN